ncbi:MAG: hypothetical protein V3T17_05390 [Pseudomonadales bacterium]
MNNIVSRTVCTTVILLAISSLSYGKCTLEAGAIPEIPDAHVATLQEMQAARNRVAQYMEAANDFVKCTRGRNDRRTPQVITKTRKLAKYFNRANKIFAARVANDPSITHDPQQLLVQK